MGRLIDIMWADAQLAEGTTQCSRRGCAARAWPGGLLAVNGNEHCNGLQGACGCAHAEATLVVRMLKDARARDHVRPYALLSTLSPCTQCARAIIESDLFFKVLYLREYRDTLGVRILRRAGIETRVVQDSDLQ